jgi:hypothetical protein
MRTPKGGYVFSRDVEIVAESGSSRTMGYRADRQTKPPPQGLTLIREKLGEKFVKMLTQHRQHRLCWPGGRPIKEVHDDIRLVSFMDYDLRYGDRSFCFDATQRRTQRRESVGSGFN